LFLYHWFWNQFVVWWICFWRTFPL
jgi:hypothetical protein